VKGNNIRVIVAKVPGAVRTLELQDGATVHEALNQAGIDDYDNYQIRDTRGTEVTVNSAIQMPASGDARITLTKRVKGN